MKLDSGAELEITVSTFPVSKALYQAVLGEISGLKISGSTEIDYNILKDLFCMGASSKKIESCLNECMKRVTYNGLKISDDTFEPVEARQDYFIVCWEVAKANLLPFTKNLSAQFALILKEIGSGRA